MPKKLITLFASLFLSTGSLLAMEDNGDPFINKLRESGEPWILLSDATIAKMKGVESQSHTFTCGPNCAARCAQACDIYLTYNQAVSECPCSIKITLPKLNSAIMKLGFLGAIAAGPVNNAIPQSMREEGSLSVGPSPAMLCKYMTERNIGKNQMKPTCVGSDVFDTNSFISNISTSLEADLPGIVHISRGTFALHYMIVVGVNEFSNQVVVQDTNGTFQIQDIDTLGETMNAGATVGLVRILNGFRAPTQLDSFSEQLITSEELANFMSVSYIYFN